MKTNAAAANTRAASFASEQFWGDDYGAGSIFEGYGEKVKRERDEVARIVGEGLSSKGGGKPDEGLFDNLIAAMTAEAVEISKREAVAPDRERFTSHASVDSDRPMSQKKRGGSMFKAGAKAVVAAGKMKRRGTSFARRKTVKDDVVEEETF